MKQMGTAIIEEKNRLFTEHPWIFLFDLQVDSQTNWYFAAYPEEIIWNDITWQPMMAAVELFSMESSGRLAEVVVHASNVARQVSAYQENADLNGNDITLYLVNRGHLDELDVIAWEYRINSLTRGDTDAVFELGHEDMFLIQLPHVRHIRDRCAYRFRDLHCKYPNDYFEAGTEQNLRWGGDVNKGGGWNTLNIDNTEIADINQTNAGKLTVKTASGGGYYFWGPYRTAPQIYKEFSGNFDLQIWFNGPVTQDSNFLFYYQSPNDPGLWHSIGMKESGGSSLLFWRNSINEVSTQHQIGEAYSGLRLVRSGSLFLYQGQSDVGGDWTGLIYGTTGSGVIFPQDNLRVGFVFPTATPDAGVEMTLEYFVVTSGGLSACDYTFDGFNGCRKHMNQTRFGGAAGLPYGRLYV